MTNNQYRAVPAYSNSDLSELLNLRTGKQSKPIDPKAAAFGTTFHSLILEPDVEIDWSIHHVTERYRLMQMVESYRASDAVWLSTPIIDTFHPSQVEQSLFWIDPETGLPLKGRLDAIVDGGDTDWLFDLKTTSARSADEFFESITTYGYDRQAAFYIDGYTNLNLFELVQIRFVFLAVQKQRPFDVFTVDMWYRSAMIDAARTKSRRLLQDAYSESLKPDGWRPSSWSR